MANDSTTLNSGSGGDALDESAVIYSSAPTTRKRPRVVLGDDNIASAFAKISPFGTLSTNEITKLAGETFTGSALDTNVWTETLAGIGAASSLSGGIITLNPALTGTGRVLETSVKVGRFLASHPNLFLGRFAFGDTGDANNIRRFGCFTATDGFFFELNGTTPRLVTRKASADTAITSFNGTASAWTLDTSFHNYEVRVSLGTLSFFVDGNWVHSANFAATTWAATPHLPIALESVNSGIVVGTNTLLCCVASYARMGEQEARTNYKFISGAATTTLKTGVGNLDKILFGVGGNSGTVTLWDNTAGSGTEIFTGTLASNGGQLFLPFDIDFNIGLTVVTTGASTGVLVSWE